MSLRSLPRLPISIVALLLAGASASGCSSDAPSALAPAGGSTGNPSAGAPASSGTGNGSSGANSAAGSSTGGGSAQAGNTGAAGSSSSNAGTGNTAGSGGGVNGSAGAAGAVAQTDPAPPHPLNVDPNCKCQLSFTATNIDPTAGKSTSDTHAGEAESLYINPTKKPQGKLVIVLGGLGGGPGGGGIEGFAKANGFHVFAVATQTAVSSAPQKYKDALKNAPMDPEANRQVGDARMEAWDGKDRVDWLDIKPPDSIVNRTAAALQYGIDNAPGGDWGYYLNADGSVRWTDVFMVGYSFGSQTIAMVSKYVRFGRVFTTSGPQDEGFPNATWISQPSATPVERLFMAVGFTMAYPSIAPQDSEVTGMFQTVTKAGWIATPIVNVNLGFAGPFNGAHLLAMIGGDGGISPGGHAVFCIDNPKDQWIPACNYAFDVK